MAGHSRMLLPLRQPENDPHMCAFGNFAGRGVTRSFVHSRGPQPRVYSAGSTAQGGAPNGSPGVPTIDVRTAASRVRAGPTPRPST
jgi:hypothetical protein